MGGEIAKNCPNGVFWLNGASQRLLNQGFVAGHHLQKAKFVKKTAFMFWQFGL
jgi:hypothetical protein